jgi:hypothetical protein
MDAIVNMMDMIGRDTGGMTHIICRDEMKFEQPEL